MTFLEFHQEYIDSARKPTELSNIIHGIMDKMYPPMPPKMIKKAMARKNPHNSYQGSSLTLNYIERRPAYYSKRAS